MESFDFVIVGGGSSGSVVAARLVEAGATVCLLEAGPSDSSIFIRMPAGFVKVAFDPRKTWGFMTEANEATGIRSKPMIQGKVLGGGGSINGMVYARGQAADYDHWAQLGNRGWSHADVLPYFRRGERRLGKADPAYRGSTGRLTVSDLAWPNRLVDSFVETVAGRGVPRNDDYNGAAQEGVGTYQYTIDRGRRVSASHAFLRPLRGRSNLSVRTNAQATRLLFEGNKAVGVAYRRAGSDSVVRANREVIVCAGAINTPRLLQVSGVGPAALLRDIGVDVVHDLPGVGENLQDHFAARMTFTAHGAETINDVSRGLPLLGQLLRWSLRRPSVVGMGVIQGAAFMKSHPDLDNPDYVMSFTAGSLKEGVQGVLDSVPGLTLGFYQLRPQSRGYVRARSTDLSSAPVVQPNYLSAPGDQTVLLAAMRSAREVARAQPLASFVGDEILPGAGVDSDDALLAFARERGTSGYHVCGSCRMGPANDKLAVVDAELKVRGIGGLRVADASIMPAVPSGNTNAPAMMIGEKAADLILGRTASVAAA